LVAGLIAAFTNPLFGPGLVYYYAVLVIIARLLLGVGIVGLHALQQGSYGRIGRAGFYAVLVAIALQVLGALVSLITRSPALAWLVSPVGLLVLIVGFVLYGAASLQARVLPRWYAVLLIVFVPVSAALGSAYGNIWSGAVLLVLGFVLYSRSEALVEDPPRVR